MTEARGRGSGQQRNTSPAWAELSRRKGSLGVPAPG